MKALRLAVLAAVSGACAPPTETARPDVAVARVDEAPRLPPRARTATSNSGVQGAPPVAAATRALPAQLDLDGNDELTSEGSVPPRGHFEKVGRHWAALERVCDFATHGDALYLAHATRPLGLGGASLTRYSPQAKPPFSLAFSWNREGEPEKGGGAGQGFLRLRNIEGRLYAPDADPPYLGLGLATGVEGYVFVSDASGAFPPARRPGHLPPRAPTPERGGALVLPGAVHGFDVIRFRGKLYASTSAMIPPNGSAKSSPGVLLTPGDGPGPWQVAFSYPGAPGEDSVRLGYMTRFRDRLYLAISPLYGLDTHDFLVIAPPREQSALSPADARAVRVTASGGAHTLRWYTDRGKLYWLTVGRDGAELRVSEDGERFRVLELPREAGAASDVLRVGEHLLVLAEHGLYELAGDGFALRAPAPEGKPPFKVDDAYCAAPLVAFQGSVYAGDQQRGNLWRLVAD